MMMMMMIVVVVLTKPVETLNECFDNSYFKLCHNFYWGILLNHCFIEYACHEFKRFLKERLTEYTVLTHESLISRHKSCKADNVHCFLTRGCFRQPYPLNEEASIPKCMNDMLHDDRIKTELQILGLYVNFISLSFHCDRCFNYLTCTNCR